MIYGVNLMITRIVTDEHLLLQYRRRKVITVASDCPVDRNGSPESSEIGHFGRRGDTLPRKGGVPALPKDS